MKLEPADKVLFHLPEVGEFVAYVKHATDRVIHMKGCKLVSPHESANSHIKDFYKKNQSQTFKHNEISVVSILEKGPFAWH